MSGVVMLSDAGLTLIWQEPVSAVYATIRQSQLGDDLSKLELAMPIPGRLEAVDNGVDLAGCFAHTLVPIALAYVVAARSPYWTLAAMLGYTWLGLWLLSSA